MPELPEVETIVRELNERHLVGRRIDEIVVSWPRTISKPEVEEFCAKVRHRVINKISRRGKFIAFTLDSGIWLVHLRMTGKFTLSKENKRISSHERVRVLFDDGQILHFEDQRKFGKWTLIPNLEIFLNQLGIEPLSDEFSLKTLQTMLQKSAQPIKPFLLNQRRIAGLGNIYVDEALWEAKIHPARKANTLTQTEISALHDAIPQVLKQGIAHMGTSLGSSKANYFSVSGRRGGNQTQLKVFRREKLPCPRCHTPLIKITFAQRGTHLCPHCQKAL